MAASGIVPVLVSANGEWDALVSILQPAALHQCAMGQYFQTKIAAQPCLFLHSG